MASDLPDDEIRALLDAATEGPWSAERDLPYNRMPRVHSDADRSLICECGNVGTTQDQWEANARLIAAAPDLAAALLAAREEIERLTQGIERYLTGAADYRPVAKPHSDKGPSKHDKCPHDVYMWADCGNCIDEYFEKLLRPAPPKEGE